MVEVCAVGISFVGGLLFANLLDLIFFSNQLTNFQYWVIALLASNLFVNALKEGIYEIAYGKMIREQMRQNINEDTADNTDKDAFDIADPET